VGELLRRGERIPGLGHFVYQTGDPRAVLLLDLIRAAAPEAGRLAVAEAVLAEARRRALPAPNIEFALAVLSTVAGMIPGSGEAVFAVARTAGWLGHALEEDDPATPVRPRGGYTRPPPAPQTAAARPGIRSGGGAFPLPERRSWRPAMAVRRLNHAVLYVSDLARVVEFYRYALGFEVRMEIPGRAAFLRAPESANDHDLGLFEVG